MPGAGTRVNTFVLEHIPMAIALGFCGQTPIIALQLWPLLIFKQLVKAIPRIATTLKTRFLFLFP